ncbi:MAG TPA: hypothetical protein VMK13_11960 [Streptosporangiaceae bacterium]|nr:hypothetical protein [Streptosporangiaceae bacterium]
MTGGTFTGNTAEGDGGGIDNFKPIHAGLTVTGGTFTGNTAKSGGGMPKVVQLRVTAASRRPRTPVRGLLMRPLPPGDPGEAADTHRFRSGCVIGGHRAPAQ